MKLTIEKNPEKRLTPEQRKAGMGKGFVYHQSHQPFLKVKVLIKNLEKEPEIYVNKIEKKIYKIPQLADFLIRIEKTQQGKAELHGAAVCDRDGNGYLFGAQQDIGKTTLILLLSKTGYYILGDDHIEVSKEGDLGRIQEKMGIFPHPENLKDLPLSFKEKLIAFLKYHFLRRHPFCNIFYPNLKIAYSKFPKVADKGKLKKIFILEKGTPGIYKFDKKEAIRKFLAITLEIMLPEGFPKTMFFAYCFKNEISPTILGEKYKEILNSAFEGKEIFLLKGESPFDFYKLFLKHEGR
jgi:hypothetical protein